MFNSFPLVAPAEVTDKNGVALRDSIFVCAPGQGLEPQFLGPEPSVLPLDDPGICVDIIS